MEKINTEILVNSLFLIGFDKVDAILFTYTLGKLSIQNRKNQWFEFEEEKTSKLFDEYVDYDGLIFSLKKGITLETNASFNKNKYLPLKFALRTNRKLIEYLTNFDFEEIVIKKINDIGLENVKRQNALFSNKEKSIICEIFDIKSEHISEMREQNGKNSSYARTKSLN